MQSNLTTNITKTENRTERPGYKKTKLGWIPEEWSTPTIPEVFQFLRTTSFSRSQMNYDENVGVYCIHYGDIHATYQRPILDFDKNAEIPKINNDVELPSNIDLLEDGDLIIADASEDYEGIGTAIELSNINGKEVLSGLHTFAFRDINAKTVQGFRAYIFRNLQVKKALKTIATGSKVYGVSKGNLKKFRIVLPPLPEQQKIAKILSTWDMAIATQEQLIAAKETFKKGLMQVLLTGKKRFEGFEGEWEEIKLKNIGTVFTGGTPSSDIAKYWNGNLIWYTPSEIKGAGKYIDDSLRRISAEGLAKSSAKIFPNKTIVICTRATIGELSISLVEACTNQGFKNLKPNKNHDVEFIYYLLKSSKIDFLKKACGSTFLELSTNDFRNMKICVPSLLEQRKIALVLSEADKEIALQRQQLVLLQDQKRGLMQRLLTGQVRVKIDNK